MKLSLYSSLSRRIPTIRVDAFTLRADSGRKNDAVRQKPSLGRQIRSSQARDPKTKSRDETLSRYDKFIDIPTKIAVKTR